MTPSSTTWPRRWGDVPGGGLRRGDLYFFSKNDGLQNQSVIWVQKGLDGTPEVLLDPNTFSADGTTTLSTFSVSRDGRYAVYGQSVGGSDWSEYRILEVGTKQALSDVVGWVKVSGAARARPAGSSSRPT